MFQVRIHSIDYCLAAPTRADFAASRAPIARLAGGRKHTDDKTDNASKDAAQLRVPVIRVFGATADGQIACAHVHGVFPYLFVPFDGFPLLESDRVIARVRHGLDRGLGRTAVLAVTLVRGVPFYGFHVGFRTYLKIYLLDPSLVSRAADLLRQGRVAAGLPPLMPHEAHVPFLLQFMTDYNLYGCDILEATAARPRPSSAPPGKKSTSCPVQVDVFAHHIRNRCAVPERRQQHQDIPETPAPAPAGGGPSERLVSSLSALWREMAARYDKAGEKSAEARRAWEAISTQEAFSQLGASSSDPRRSPPTWIHEEEYRQQIADIVASEQRLLRDQPFSLPPREPLEQLLPTTRQSVEDFYPRSARTVKAMGNGTDSSESEGEVEDEEDEEDKVEDKVDQRAVADTEAQSHMPLSGSTHFSLSPDFENQLGSLLDQVEGHIKTTENPTENPTDKTEKPVLSNEWLRSQQSQSQSQSEPSRSQELPLHTRRRPAREAKEAHRPLSQTFPVVKSAFQDERKLSQTPSQTLLLPQPLTPASDDSGDDSDDDGALVIPSTPDDQLAQLTSPWRDEPTRRVRTGALVVPGTPKDEDDEDDEDGDGDADGDADNQALEVDWPSGEEGPFYRVAPNMLVLSRPAPTVEEVTASLGAFGPDEVHRDAYFGNDADVPKTKSGKAGKAGKPGKPCKPGIGRSTSSLKTTGVTCSWELAALPPSQHEVEAWLAREREKEAAEQRTQAAEERATRERMLRGRLPHDERAAALQAPTSAVQQLDLRTLCLEVHANSRGAFLPNPERDAVQCVVWRAAGGRGRRIPATEDDEDDADGLHVGKHGGVITVARPLRDDDVGCVDVAADEEDLIRRVIRLVHRLDPDLLAGYEVAASSWGYLSERAALHGLDLWQELARVPEPGVVPFHERSHHQGVTGRYVLSVGQALRADVALRQYTLESAAWHVLGHRVPVYRPHVLTAWATSGQARDLGRLVRHYRRRAAIGMALMEATELVARTSEQARVLGVDFASVLGRGSQFKVESVMLRVAKPENFVLPSPSHEQVGQQNAAACTPMVLEPRSALYTSPVVVLDFASLYPSLMIAYNLCYSTFAGRLDPHYQEKKAAGAGVGVEAGAEEEATTTAATATTAAAGGDSLPAQDETADKIAEHAKKTATKLGFSTYERPPGLLAQLSQLGLVVSPTGMIFVGARTRQSLLAKMLAEILDTRTMVKAAMKTTATLGAERQRLHNRQLALKLLANVTYGYTSASFSGRMPCVEVADSIVQAGRQTLERAMALIHAERRWGAEVVYGDTDSLFVHLPGRTRAQAFQLGAEMAEAVTAANPHPVRLKFEKVYHPCVLLAKKRYVGYAFDGLEQAEPVFDAKGIETVRRDGSPAAAKVLEESLRILFDTADLSRVKAFLQARFADVMQGRLSVADLCFAKEVRPPGSYRAPPPGAVVASRRLAQDPCAVLLDGERVPYVVVAGAPGTPLRDRCVAPEDVVRHRRLRIDSDYYIQHSLVPPLDRVLRLVGVDVLRWYLEMPRARMPLRAADPAPTQSLPPVPGRGATAGGQQTLDAWLRGTRCARCDQPVRRRRRRGRGWWQSRSLGPGPDQNAPDETPVLCRRCGRDRGTLLDLQARARAAERAYADVLQGCRGCAQLGPGDAVRCENMTCAVYFVRTERAVAAKVERAKAPLLAMLARRGMRDLAW